jgi:glycerophosphoryl diester phosphodiesterase
MARRTTSPLPRVVVAAATSLVATAVAPAADVTTCRHPFGRPLVFAHRGASGERPEHTIAAYRLAIEQGADYVEPDLRRTKDGIFICCHDATLERTTDVADRPAFAARSRLDGTNDDGGTGRRRWHVQDFTLAELRTLRTRQGTSGRPRTHDGIDPVPTFAELVALVREHNRGRPTKVGITPELKDGDADAFVDLVRSEKIEAGPEAVPLHVQSFDLDTVRRVRARLVSPCVWLLGRLPTAAEIDAATGAVDGFSIAKSALAGADAAAVIDALRGRGMCVVAWTFADDRCDTKQFRSPQAEIEAAFASGIDAIFTDFPATGVKARDAFLDTR